MDVLGILQKIGYTRFNETQTHYAIRPLHRESDNDWAVAVDKRTGKWYDFVQKEGGSIYKLVALTKDLKTKKEVEAFLQMDVGQIGFDSGVQHRYELEETKRFDKMLLSKLVKDHSYWINRGISLLTIDTFNGGTTTNGRMKNRYVFPIFNEQGELIGFSGRNLGIGEPKWKTLGKKTHFVYPKLKAQYQHKTIIVESIGDMLSLVEIGIPHVLVAFGINVSPKIVEFLLRYDTQKIFVILNNDEDNNFVGNQASLDCSSMLLKYFDASQIKNLTLPYKDVNEFLMSNKNGLMDYCSQMELYV